MTTTVVLIRHAKVDSLGQNISETGKRLQHKMNRRLKEHGVTPDSIWHSPALRTKETAEVISHDFGVPIHEEILLGEYFDEEELLQKLPPSKTGSCLFLVGHAPSLTRFATYLLGGSYLTITLDNSSALVLAFERKVEAGQAVVVRYYNPQELVR